MLLLLMLLVGNLDQILFVTDVAPIALHTFPPVAIVNADEIAIFTEKLELVLWDGHEHRIVGQKGPGPGEFDQYFRALYAHDRAFVVVHQGGNRIERFDAKGDLQDSGRQADRYLRYVDDRNVIGIRPHRDDFLQVNVDWRHHAEQQLFTMGIRDGDAVSPVGTAIQVGGAYALIYTHRGTNRTFYYRLLNLNVGHILDGGEVGLVDQRISQAQRLAEKATNATVPIIEGCTYSSELGFVLTENTLPGSFRILRMMVPDKQLWKNVKVMLDDTDITYFQHLEGDRWLGYSRLGDWITFRLEETS